MCGVCVEHQGARLAALGAAEVEEAQDDDVPREALELLGGLQDEVQQNGHGLLLQHPQLRPR